MRRSAGRIFIRGLIQSFFIVAFLLIAGVLSYQLTMHFLKAPEEDSVVAYQNETVQDVTVLDSSMEPVTLGTTRNLIFCYNDKSKKIKKVVLEVFDSVNYKLTYLTIPMRTQLTLSDSLYHKMMAVNPSTPRIMQLSAISGYLEYDSEFRYAVIMIEDLLGIDINYYTAIPQSLYKTCFVSTDQVPAVEVFSDKYMDYLKSLKSEEKIRSYIKDIYRNIYSDLSLTEKLKYSESYYLTQASSISFELIKGMDQNSAYRIDSDQAKQQLESLESSGPEPD